LDLTAAIAEPESGSEPPEAAVAPAEPKSPALEFLDTSGEEKPAKPEESAPVTGLISQELPPDKIYRLHPELTQGFKSAKEDPDRLDVELEEDVELRSSGAAEFRMPNAAEDFMDLAARMNAARAELPPTDPPLPATMEVSQPPAAEVAPHPL